MYHAFCKNNWIPCKDNGEILDIGGFGAQFRIVKCDVNHNFNDLGIRFLYKAASKLGGNGEGVHGMSPIGVSARMLGLHNSTVRDVLILNGDIMLKGLNTLDIIKENCDKILLWDSLE